jgi:hypothetical protein
MVCAAIIKCPVFGGTVKSVNEGAIASRRGVLQVVKLKDAVAVVADRYFRAQAVLKVFPDQAMTLAAIDRLLHRATILEMNVESYRRRAALDRKRGPGRPPTRTTIKENA